jgi:23S rRNA U2552 (ribose-2'-O)-methylase RlmE/FtsJ
MVNPYEIVFTHEDTHFHPSLSSIKPLSRSYFKMVEMFAVLDFFDRLPKQQVKIRSAHVAEGPGGFIQALVDLAERYRRTLHQATAMTLKPTDTHVPGWRRATAFLHAHKEVKLHYGADGTGDIYLPANQASFVATTHPGVDLFTADGGFDFSIDYSIQEKQVFRLLCSSATIGLRCLSENGCMVLKLFDIFSESTRILLVLLGRCFKEWMLYKPCLSRPCNSERYFLGRCFRGVSKETLRHLDEFQGRVAAENTYPIGLASFATAEETEYLAQQSAASVEQQLVALKRAMTYRDHPEVWYADQLPRDFETSLAWCYKYRIPTNRTKPLTVLSQGQSQAPK